MKKLVKFKRYGLALTAIIVCLAVIATCFTFAIPSRVFAASGDPDANFDLIATTDSIPSTCKFDEEFAVPDGASGVTVKVTAPNGDEVTVASNKVKATQVGNYIISYSKDGVSQEFPVKVTLDKDFFIKVKNNGADIKSNMKIGDEFVLPTADVVYYDDNNILRSYPGTVDVTVVDSLGGEYDPDSSDNAQKTFKATENGKVYITYTASIGGAGGKYYSQTFTVNVNSTYNDKSIPTLTVSGLPSSISVGRAVTLPKATVSDDYDTNIRVDITVLDPDGKPVRIVDIDKNGYAYQDSAKLTADESITVERDKSYPVVDFDNDKSMTFYPLKTGTYKITYVATDDADRTSATKLAQPTCGDSVAPVFKEIDDYMIPETWGLSVTNKDGSVEGGKITMPIPTLVDNCDHMPTHAEGEDDKLISLYFRVTDADRSTNIIEFKNILAKPGTDACTVKANDKYGADVPDGNGGTKKDTYEFSTANPFTFDLSLYHRKQANSTTADNDKTGKYTIYYRAEDKAGNRSTKSYTVTIEDTYEDKNEPSTAEVTVPKYISVPSDESFTVPTPAVADAKDTRLKVDYRIYSIDTADVAAADDTYTNYMTVDGGEKLEFVEDESVAGKWYLVRNKDKSYYDETKDKLELKENLYFYVKATDSAGNVKVIDDATKFTESKAVVKVVTQSLTASATMTLNSTISLNVVDGNTKTPYDGNNIYTDSKVNAGGFNIVTTAALRKYVGFEVAVLDEDGNAINTTLETHTVFDEGANTATIYVHNITFTPSAVGTHFLKIRAFDVNGKNTVKAYKFNVKKSTSGTGSASASVISTTGSVNVKYMLHNETIKNVGSSDKTYFVVRKIQGRSYSLMGSEFTAKSQGGFYVTDGYAESTTQAGTNYADFKTSATPYGANGGSYSFQINDSESPVIEVQGAMPMYRAKNANVVLPAIYAYTESGTANVEITVKNSSGKEVELKTGEDASDAATYGKKYFVGSSDGNYTVTVVATHGKTESRATYTVSVGDVTAPQFSVNCATSIRLKQGEKFEYAAIELADGESDSNVTITKKIEDPSKEIMSTATVNGSYKNYADKKDNGTEIYLTSSGTYKVYYYAEDELHNGSDSPYIVEVIVSASGSSTPTTFTTLSTVLIIIAVVLLAGVIVYVVRFRKVKK